MWAIQKHRLHLGEAIRAKREEAGLSQEKLVEKADLSRVFIGRIARGVESPSFDNLVKIAKALGVRVRVTVSDIKNSANPINYPSSPMRCWGGALGSF